jgi:hypothetical protein
VQSWALFLMKPSDLGCSDDGYILPALDVHWHEVSTDHSQAGADRDGQALMFKDTALGGAGGGGAAGQHRGAHRQDERAGRRGSGDPCHPVA